jgi:hypothetical protein
MLGLIRRGDHACLFLLDFMVMATVYSQLYEGMADSRIASFDRDLVARVTEWLFASVTLRLGVRWVAARYVQDSPRHDHERWNRLDTSKMVKKYHDKQNWWNIILGDRPNPQYQFSAGCAGRWPRRRGIILG